MQLDPGIDVADAVADPWSFRRQYLADGIGIHADTIIDYLEHNLRFPLLHDKPDA
ncbi:hypothetical protein D3C75_866190 [compost metagenome]